MHEHIKAPTRARENAPARHPGQSHGTLAAGIAIVTASFGPGCAVERSHPQDEQALLQGTQPAQPVVVDPAQLVQVPRDYLGKPVQADGFIASAGFAVIKHRYTCYEKFVFRATPDSTHPGLSFYLESHPASEAHPRSHAWEDSLTAGPVAVSMTGVFRGRLVSPRRHIVFDGTIQKR